jgi:glycosyltransferase involved in cell wall biosynthesis
LNAGGAAPELSLVIPVYNERDNLAPLVGEIAASLRPAGYRYEVLMVDDGSTDGSAESLAALGRDHPELRVVRLARNAGQTAAMDAGFRRARGAVVVTLDADLQNDPADIPLLVRELEGWDAVVGVRRVRRDGLVRRVSSRVANYVRNRLSDETITDTGCSLKAYRRDAVARLKLYRGMHRFLPTLLKMEGFRVREIPVGHRPRAHGRSKYGISNRLVPSFVDLLAVRWMKKRMLRYEVKDDA